MRTPFYPSRSGHLQQRLGKDRLQTTSTKIEHAILSTRLVYLGQWMSAITPRLNQKRDNVSYTTTTLYEYMFSEANTMLL